jgi:hypothetical protein
VPLLYLLSGTDCCVVTNYFLCAFWVTAGVSSVTKYVEDYCAAYYDRCYATEAAILLALILWGRCFIVLYMGIG